MRSAVELFRFGEQRQFPRFALAERRAELALEHPFLFQMDVAGGVARLPADARRVAVLHRRVEGDVLHHLARPFRRELRFSCDDREPVRIAGEELRRHEGVVVHVRPDVVGGALPAVEFPLLAERVTRGRP